MSAADIVDAAVAEAGGADQIVQRNSPHRVTIVRGSDLNPKPIAWLWRDWLALGKLHILAGAPGQGKTTIAMDFAAIVSAGRPWPDGANCKPGRVLIWSGEDDPSDTLIPRLIAAGGDPSKVYFVTGAHVRGEVASFDPARDLVQLTRQAEEIGDVRLLIADPVVTAVTGDSHKNTEVRRGLQPLVDLANSLNAAVLGVTHFSKGSGGRDPTERVTGSVAFGAVARVVLVAAKVKSENGQDRRILARSKSNIGPDDGGFEYGLEQAEASADISASRVAWGRSIAGAAKDLLIEPGQESTDFGASAKEAAVDFLRAMLGTPALVSAVRAESGAAGHSWATIRRASAVLKVVRKKSGMTGGWEWSLPEGAQDSPKALTQIDEHLREKVSTFGDSCRELSPTVVAPGEVF